MTITRDAITGIIVLGLVLIGIIWYAATHPAPEPQGWNAQVPQQNDVDASPQHLTAQGDIYTVDAQYPGATPLVLSAGAEADAAAVATIKGYEQQAIQEFATNISGYDGEFKQHIIDEGLKASLQIEYAGFISPATVSYVLGIYEDTMGAHPNTFYQTFTWDAATGTQLAVGDLFDDPNYLTTLSQIARAKLPAMIADRESVSVGEINTDMLMDGTQPTAENFSTFYLDASDMVLLFPPYQVGPYVLGSMELHIPRTDLPGLKAQYR